MQRIRKIDQRVKTKFLSYYELEVQHRGGRVSTYYMASRVPEPRDLQVLTGQNRPDGVIIYGVYGERKDRVVLIRQYRYPIGGYVYEFPAGLLEPGEDPAQAGAREIFEETGLTFVPKEGGSYGRPFYTTVGMTDESCATVYGYCTGTPTNIHQELSEDIQVVLADRAECRRILREEHVAIMCAYMLMHFIATPGDPLAFLDAAT